MDCEFLERVSLLIDGEMSGEESEHVRKHIAGCVVCRRAEQEFLLVRQQIRSYKPETDSYSAERALRKITGRKPIRWWKKKIALPAPACALIALVILAMLAWSLFVRKGATEPGAVNQARKPSVSDQPDESQPDFSRYDHGARAVIYKARRTPAGNLEQ